ncbi:hypothetical protein GQ53DRAFT_813247 [Thozetella sp. PMI_491]|nr:hypothetical protein GQ53DRAFT_813247 [Thozetella sp. PMI_491]
MAHQTPRIPWHNLAANFEYLHQNHKTSGPDAVTDLYPKFLPNQGPELNAFVDAFASAMKQDSERERKKYPEHYEQPQEDEVLIGDATVRKILPTARRIRHDETPKCECPIPHSERKTTAFLRGYEYNDCWEFFDVNEAAFFNLELVKTLLLMGEMEPVLRACAHPENDYLEWWMKQQCMCMDADIGWNHVAQMALNSYLCLNLLCSKPAVWNPAAGRTEANDYRLTRCYQNTVRYCCASDMTSTVATYPHKFFYGVAENQFRSMPVAREQDRWGHLKHKHPSGLLTVDEFLTFERICPYQPSGADVSTVRQMLYRMGLPMELVLDIMEAGDYTISRRLKVPHDPLHPDNAEDLRYYLDHCWQILVCCDMMSVALGDPIPWAALVSQYINDLGSKDRYRILRASGGEVREMSREKYDHDDPTTIGKYILGQVFL